MKFRVRHMRGEKTYEGAFYAENYTDAMSRATDWVHAQAWTHASDFPIRVQIDELCILTCCIIVTKNYWIHALRRRSRDA